MQIQTIYSIGDVVWVVIRTIGGSWISDGPIEITRFTVSRDINNIHEVYQGKYVAAQDDTGRLYSLKNMYRSQEEAEREAANRTQKGYHKLFGAMTFLEKQPDLPEGLREYIEQIREEVEDL